MWRGNTSCMSSISGWHLHLYSYLHLYLYLHLHCKERRPYQYQVTIYVNIYIYIYIYIYKVKTSCVHILILMTRVINIRLLCVLIISVTHPLYVDQPQSDKTYQSFLLSDMYLSPYGRGSRVSRNWIRTICYKAYPDPPWSSACLCAVENFAKTLNHILQSSCQLNLTGSTVLNCFFISNLFGKSLTLWMPMLLVRWGNWYPARRFQFCDWLKSYKVFLSPE